MLFIHSCHRLWTLLHGGGGGGGGVTVKDGFASAALPTLVQKSGDGAG